MLTKEPDLQKWADSILATEPSERAEMVAEDPSVFEVVRKALDSERQTVAKLREVIYRAHELLERGIHGDCYDEKLNRCGHSRKYGTDVSTDTCDQALAWMKMYDNAMPKETP